MSDSRTEKVMDAANVLASLVSTKPAGAGSLKTVSPPTKINGENGAGPTGINTPSVKDEVEAGRASQQMPPINALPGYSASSEQSSFASSASMGGSSATSRSKSTKFPIKLMNLLTTPEYESIIGWSECGTMFTIHNPKAFVADVLPQFFKQAKFTSFLRKLYRWGFAKRTDMEKHPDKESATYFHPKFQKGRAELCRAMSCSTRGGVIQDSSTDPMGPSARHQYFAQHGRPMMPEYGMNMGHYPPNMMYGGPQHPSYNYHGQPMGPPGKMFPPPPNHHHPGMNGPVPGPPGMMPMNNGMMMDNSMYNQEYPPMRHGHGNGPMNGPPQMQNGGQMPMGNPNDNDARQNVMAGQGLGKNGNPTKEKNSNGPQDGTDPSRKDGMMMDNGVDKDGQRSSQSHPASQHNNMMGMNQNDPAMMRQNPVMFGHQGNRQGMDQNGGVQKHDKGQEQHHQMQQGNNHWGNMPPMGHYDQNSFYYGQQQQQHGQYPMNYPPPGPSYPPMNGGQPPNGMAMPGQRGPMPNMYSAGPAPGRHMENNMPGPSPAIKSGGNGEAH